MEDPSPKGLGVGRVLNKLLNVAGGRVISSMAGVTDCKGLCWPEAFLTEVWVCQRSADIPMPELADLKSARKIAELSWFLPG